MAESYLQSFCDEEDEQKGWSSKILLGSAKRENGWKLQALCIPSSFMVSLSPPLIINCASNNGEKKNNFPYAYGVHGIDEREREKFFFSMFFFLKE